MKKLALKDIRGPRVYGTIRDDLRRKIIELKKHRRVQVGEAVTLVFENRATMIFQIEEMLHAEQITEPAKVQEEIDVYNSLLPDEGELAATLFIEIADQAVLDRELHRMIGIDEHVSMRIGGAGVARARFEPGRQEADRLATVQYIKFPLAPAQRAAFPASEVAIVVDHPNYKRELVLSPEVRASLAQDLE